MTDKYYEDKSNGILQSAEEVNDFAASIVELIDSVYNPRAMQPENARSNNVELRVNEEKFAMPEFQALWSKINAKSIYIVDFDIDELIRNAITSLDAKDVYKRQDICSQTGIPMRNHEYFSNFCN